MFFDIEYKKICDIISPLSGETGENPVRARRREVLFVIYLSVAAKQRKAIESFTFEKVINNAPSRNTR